MERRFTLGGAVQFPVAMDMRYKTSGRTPRVGLGRTVWMSRSEVTFTTERPLERGTKLELSIAWPVLLNGRVLLQLVVEGEIIGAGGTTLTAAIRKHHFRTRGQWNHSDVMPRPIAAQPAPPAVPNNPFTNSAAAARIPAAKMEGYHEPRTFRRSAGPPLPQRANAPCLAAPDGER